MKKLLLFLFCLSPLLGVAQDTCTSALPISAGTHTVAAVNGTHIPNPICAANGPGNTSAGEWYSYTPAQDYTVTVSTDLPANNGRDTRVHVYVGNCLNLLCIAGDDDGGDGYTSVVTFNVTANTTYRIAFDNRWTSLGFDFVLTEAPVTVPVPGAVSFTMGTHNSSGTKKCVVDMNGDYLDDIVAVNSTNVNILYQQAAGGFNSVVINTPQADFMPGWSIASGDLDRNGYNDLLYGAGSGVTFMYQNNTGDGFTEFSGPQNVFSQRSNFVDINNDGHLDAFVCHDVAPNVYYLNDGSGNLTFVQGGLGNFPTGGNYGSIWVDYDNDGDPDLFIAKCRGGNSGANIDELHRNDGNGVFTNVSIPSNMNEASQSWSSAWGDFDNDGDMDALIGASTFANGGHKLRRNNSDGTFTDITVGSGYDTFTGTGIEYVAHDFNNDGWVDVFGSNNTIMLNNGDMTFSPLQVTPSNGPIGDLNNDGFLDIQNGNSIYFNNPNSNNWIKFHLQGVASNRNGIGARVELYGAWGMQIRDVRSGDGFAYMSSLNVHFGIGSATEITQVIIRWPSGTVDIINNPAINAALYVLEGSSLAVNNFSQAGLTLYPNPASDFLNISSDQNYQFSTAEIYDLAGRKIITTQITQQQQIPVASLSNGTYIIMLTDDAGRNHTAKFIKN